VDRARVLEVLDKVKTIGGDLHQDGARAFLDVIGRAGEVAVFPRLAVVRQTARRRH